MTAIFLHVAVIGTLYGFHASAFFQKPIGKCGDGVCDSFENARPDVCPEDCQGITRLPYEDSAFGVFVAFAANEFPYFKDRMHFTNDQYWSWAEYHMKSLGAHWTRSNLQLIWDKIEPVIGRGYHWNNEFLTDPMIGRMYSPQNEVHWLGVFHDGTVPEPPYLRDPLQHPDQYKKFVRAVVERYDGDGINDAAPGIQVKYWQAGNEIVMWRHAGRSVQDYVRYTRMVRESVKAADPGAKLVLMAPINGRDMDPFLIDVIHALADEKGFDVIDVHHWEAASDWKMPAVPQYRQMLDSLGLQHVQIWSTEHGTWQGAPSQPPIAQSEQDQARSLIRRYVYNLNNGLDKLFWNNLMEWYRFTGTSGNFSDSMGLITDGQGPGEDPGRFNTERIAYWAYTMLASKIDTHISRPAGLMPEVYKKGRMYGYAYTRRDNGKRLYILWSETGPGQVTFGVDAPSVLVTNMITDRFGNILGQKTVLARRGTVTLTVGVDPLLVEE